jgi:hypothetical protein
VELASFSRFVVDADDRLRLRPLAVSAVKRDPLQNRDIIKLFAGLNVTESVLLKTSTRETLFRKP